MVTLREGLQMFQQGMGQLGEGMEKSGEYKRRRKGAEALRDRPEEEFEGGETGKRMALAAAVGGKDEVVAKLVQGYPTESEMVGLALKKAYEGDMGPLNKLTDFKVKIRPVYNSQVENIPMPTPVKISGSNLYTNLASKFGFTKDDILPDYTPASKGIIAGTDPAEIGDTKLTKFLNEKIFTPPGEGAPIEVQKEYNDNVIKYREAIRDTMRQSDDAFDAIPPVYQEAMIDNTSNKMFANKGKLFDIKDQMPVPADFEIPAPTIRTYYSKATKGKRYGGSIGGGSKPKQRVINMVRDPKTGKLVMAGEENDSISETEE